MTTTMARVPGMVRLDRAALQQHLDARGVGPERLALAAGVAPGTIYRVLRGGEVRRGSALKIARALQAIPVVEALRYLLPATQTPPAA